MSGDYTRLTFDPIKGFSGLRQQQGRVSLDAEFNEFEEILDRLARAEMYDIVGEPPGTSYGRAVIPRTTEHGFEIGFNTAGVMTIGPGRAYVDGILVECFGDQSVLANRHIDAVIGGDVSSVPLPYDKQPFYYTTPTFPLLSTTLTAIDLLYLDVWQREVTVYEDPSLREPALHGPDTATRIQTAWQVKTLAADNTSTCENPPPAWADLTTPTQVRMTVVTAPPPSPTGPCVIDPAGGYTGVENRLYRVEIQTAGTLGPPPPAKKRATFKWSRDNASLTARVDSVDTATGVITVSSTGRDSWMRFEQNDHIELIDDSVEFSMRETGQGGRMMRIIAAVDHESGKISVDPLAVQGFVANKDLHPRIRRWDAVNSITDPLETNVANGTPFPLEKGISITFAVAAGDPDELHAGDYWVFSARTADGSIDPPLADALPRGVLHHFARLALVQNRALLSDCRTVFPPLSEIESLFYVSGDAQSATPVPGSSAAIPLPVPIAVGVARGTFPVQNALVRFKADLNFGNGQIAYQNPLGALPDTCLTNSDGIASVIWSIDPQVPATAPQQLIAELVDELGNRLAEPIIFHATLNTAELVSYDPGDCATLQGTKTVKEALDTLCGLSHDEGGCCVSVGKGGDYETLEIAFKSLVHAERKFVCICLLPAEEPYDFPNFDLSRFEAIQISGMNPGTTIVASQRIVVNSPQAFGLSNVELIGGGLPQLLAIRDTEQVTILGCRLALEEAPDGAVTVRFYVGEKDAQGDSARILDSTIICQVKGAEPSDFVMIDKLPEAVQPLIYAASHLPEDEALKVANEFLSLPADDRQKMASDTRASATAMGKLVDAAKAPVGELAKSLRQAKDAQALLNNALAVAGVAPGVGNGAAIQFDDGHARVWIERNVIQGLITLYGGPPGAINVVAIADRLAKMTGDSSAAIRGVGELRVSGNSLQQIVFGADLLRRLKLWLSGKPFDDAPRLFKEIFISTNTFALATNELMSEFLAVSSNVFLGPSGNGIAISAAATFVGNMANPRMALHHIPGAAFQQAANVYIVFVPPVP